MLSKIGAREGPLTLQMFSNGLDVAEEKQTARIRSHSGEDPDGANQFKEFKVCDDICFWNGQ